MKSQFNKVVASEELPYFATEKGEFLQHSIASVLLVSKAKCPTSE